MNAIQPVTEKDHRHQADFLAWPIPLLRRCFTINLPSGEQHVPEDMHSLAYT